MIILVEIYEVDSVTQFKRWFFGFNSEDCVSARLRNFVTVLFSQEKIVLCL